MSTEKLSELSKPVAYMTAEGVAITHLDFESGSWGMHNAAKSDDMWCPLYSQEYVSAMLSEIGEIERSLISNCVDYEYDLIEMKRRAEAAEQRVAELERANAAQDDHINQQQDRIESLEKKNGDLGRSLGAAEKRLATPVRLTDERTLWAGEDDYDTGHVKGWNANRIEQAALLKKQGFTVEGDE